MRADEARGGAAIWKHSRRATHLAAPILLAVACARGGGGGGATPAPAPSAAGTWVGTTTAGMAGRQEFTLVLAQEGDSLHGEVTIQGSGGTRTHPVSGVLVGNRVTWTGGGRAYKFHGTVKGDSMAGMWSPTYIMSSAITLSLRRQRPGGS